MMMESSVVIRSAIQSDLERWAYMRNELWPESEDEHRQEILEYFDGNSVYIEECFLLVFNGVAEAFVEINIRDFAEGSLQPKVPFVEGWFVSENHRGKGFGKLLMSSAESWARRKGFSELASDTEVWNTRSIEVHKKLGFEEVERVVCFLKQLQESDNGS